ncbi:MAG TPA: hypothetical protein VLA36_05180 [Longimicrobiales bacterium]|nr:hypothetical protein [Longimicrobiales bacterium]
MTTPDQGRGETVVAVAVMATLAALLATYVAFYVRVPIDSDIRLVALLGMFVFLIVVVALLILLQGWWTSRPIRPGTSAHEDVGSGGSR